MRKLIFVAAFLAATMTAIAVAQGTAKAPQQEMMPFGCSHLTVVQDFRPFAEKVWDVDLWRRKGGMPKQATLEIMKDWRHCAASPRHRAKMKKAWLEAKDAFLDYRKGKMANRRYWDAISPPGLAILEAIAECESGGDPRAVSPDGSFRGKYQFDYGTWASVGGSGDPAAAPEREQDERAAALYRSRGSSPWPVCGI